MTTWNHTTFIEYSQLPDLFDAITSLFANDGYTSCGRDEVSEHRDHSQILRYGQDTDAEVWAIALLPTSTEWTVIKTSPFAILGRPPAGMLVPRLALLCRMLCCHGFLAILEESIEFYALECSAVAGYCAWGAPQADARVVDTFFFTEEPGNTRYQRWSEQFKNKYGDPQVLKPALSEQFPLLAIAREEWQRKDCTTMDHIEVLGQHITSRGLDYFGNYIQAEHLIECVPLDVPGAIVGYFRRAMNT